jgi:hypothetical protein
MGSPDHGLRELVNPTPRGLRAWVSLLRRATLVLVAGCLVLGGAALVPVTAQAAGDPCAVPVVNPVACENTRPGTTDWQVSQDASIEGFTTDISTNVGGRVDFKIRTDSPRYTIDIYRLGWYGGDGGRFITSLTPSVPLPQTQPECRRDAASGMVDCGNWGVSASWAVPADAVSGVYVANLRRQDRAAGNQITFVVRNDASRSALTFQTSDTTWAAYNAWGGANLYYGNGPGGTGRAYKVSYNRPIEVNATTAKLMYAEYPMIRFLESNGYDVSYQAGVDTDRFGHLLTNHRAFLSVGHDEYWSGAQRDNVEAARDAGVNLAFFSGNEMWWRVRWEPSIDGSGQAYRSLVSYKESLDGARTDPSGEWTGTFRDPRFGPAGVEPENALIGQQFKVNGEYGRRRDAISVPAELGAARLWRNTPVATQRAGATHTFGAGTLGYEWDSDFDNGFRPAGLAKLSLTTVQMAEPDVLQDDFGVSYAPGTATHSLTLYRAASGALVFGAGTVQWSWGLDDTHDGGLQVEDPAMQQATVNLFADMRIQPAALRSHLTAATTSTDTTPPTVTITSAKDPGATVGSPVTISGTATDAGGIVAGVEVSVDGGTTWHPAEGRASWSYTYSPTTSGPLQVRARAVDDSARLSAPVGFDSTIVQRTCPCSIWPTSARPATAPVRDAAALELGTRFQASVSGHVTGVRFYKGAGDTGTHTGSLWTADGRQLATGAFTNETAEGWQTLTFATPVMIDAGTPYVVSYYSPTGAYVADRGFFASTGVVNEPLSALRDGDGGRNGVYRSGSAGFPADSWGATNYWVDVAFTTGVPADNRPPGATVGSPLADSTSVARTAAPSVVFDESVRPESIALTLTGPGGSPVAGAVGYDPGTRTATFTPASELAAGTRFTASLTAAVDTAGNRLAAPLAWSFTTMGAPPTPGVCPCSVWDDTAVPAVVSVEEAASIELGMRFSVAGDGTVTGVRFYKGARNTGVHTGTLWSATGEQLARATATAETTSGWQEIRFDRPVPVTAGTTYVVSYHTDAGYYSYTYAGLADGVTTGPLTALAGGTTGGNGVYRYGASAFPDQPGNANYWVDVVYLPAADTVAPGVATTAPGSGDPGVAPTTTVRAVVSEPVSSASVRLELHQGTVPVAGTTTYDAATRTVAFTPSAALRAGTAYTATVSGATDAAGNVQAAPYRWTFTTALPGGCPCTVFGDAVPGTAAADDPGAVELGMRFRTTADGFVTGVRFYKGAGNTGTHTGTLWSASGQRLATGTFVNETAQGWQQLVFASPVAVTAGTSYVVSYHAPAGRYAADESYFAGKGAASGPLEAPASTAGAANGLYAYGSSSTFPQNSWQSTNYWVDAVFSPTTVVDSTPPAVSGTTPGEGSSDVATGAVLRFDFDEPLMPETARVEVSAGGRPVAGSVTLSGQRTVVFTPEAPLPVSAAVTAVVSDVQDRAGNRIAAPFTLSFRTAADDSVTCPCTIFGDGLPGRTAVTDDSAGVELGVRFRTEQDGFITGVRFYKGAGNTGTHTGSLWSASGQRLATGTFVNETAQGWQPLVFASPVAVTAGTTYVASYYAPAGGYAADDGFFEGRSAGTAPLQAPASTPDAGNGVYTYGATSTFPSSTWQSTNYWVDVVFTPAAEQTGSLASAVSSSPEPAVVPQTPAPPVAEDVQGAAGPTSSSTGSAAPGTDEPACPCSFSTADPAPTAAEQPAGERGAELGLRFRATAPGWITAVRWYAPARTDAERVGSIWADGQRVATVRLPAVAEPGWQEAVLAQPLPVSAGVGYVVSYTVPAGAVHALSDAPAGVRTAGPLEVSGGAVTGTPGALPATDVSGKDFWADVVVVTAVPAGSDRDATAPTVTSTGVADPAVTFSEPVTGVAMELTGPDGAAVPATVIYDAATLTARLTPEAALVSGRPYRVTVRSATDRSGNGITVFTWAFTAAG